MIHATGNINASGSAGYVLNAIPTGLVNSVSRQNIIAAATLLPGFREGFFECHLAQAGQVDFAIPVAIHHNEKELETLLKGFPSANFIRQIKESPLIFTPANSKCIWLEFDTSTTHYKGIAGIFFDLPYAAPSDSSFWRNRLGEIIPVIGTPHHTPANVAAIVSCIRQIQQGFPAYIGIMAGRNNELRLCTKFANPAKVPDYLQDTGRQLTANTNHKLNTLLALADIAAVDFDFENGSIAPRMGTELHVSKHRDNQLYWRKLFDHLVEYQLCTTQQKELLLKWPENEENLHADHMHRISHVKLTVNQGTINTAKVYLQYIYR